ncbi:MAG: hypothetical protein ACKO72_04965 [Actinomycetes bacterium]
MGGEQQGGGRSRTKWDEKADAARAALVEEGMVRILEEGVAGVASLVSPSALARRSGAVSIDTAYRLLGRPGDVLTRIAGTGVDPTFRSEVLGWRTTGEISAEAIGEYASPDTPMDPAAAIRQLLVAGLADPAFPLSRILRSVAITASPAWAGRIAVAEEHREVAEAVRDAARLEWESSREHLRWLVQESLGAVGRRPIEGYTIDKIVVILHTVAEGALDRLALHPEAVSIDEFVEAILIFMLALTEEGALADPRLPGDPEALELFTRVVAGADAAWADGTDLDDLHRVASRVGVPFGTVVLMFPTVGDLADSVLRARVVAAGIEGGTPDATAALLRGTLRRLAGAADAIPMVVERARDVPAATSVLHELQVAAQSLAPRPAAEDGTAARVAEQIVTTASLGLDQWATTEVLLDLLLLQPSRGSSR